MKPNPPDMSDYMTVKEVVFEFPISRATLYRKFEAKEIRRYKFGGATLVKRSELMGLIRMG